MGTQGVTITGKYTEKVSGAGIGSATINVKRTPTGGTATDLAAVTTLPDGSFTITDTVTTPGTFTYDATTLGIAGKFDPATAAPATIGPLTVATLLTTTVTLS